MSGIAAKQKRHQEQKTKQNEQAKCKTKAYKRLVLARRRQMDRARRARQRRERREHTRQRQREFIFALKQTCLADGSKVYICIVWLPTPNGGHLTATRRSRSRQLLFVTAAPWYR